MKWRYGYYQNSTITTKSGLLIDGATETVKYEIKNKKAGAIMAPKAASLIGHKASSLIEPVAYSLANAITGKGAMRAGKG